MANDEKSGSGPGGSFALCSGTYRGTIESDEGAKLTIEVRVDIENAYISADFFQTSALSKEHYRASMRAKLRIENDLASAAQPRFVFGDDDRSFVAGALEVAAPAAGTAIVKCTFPESASTLYRGILEFKSEYFRELEIHLDKIAGAPDPRDCAFNTSETTDSQGAGLEKFDVSVEGLFARAGIKATISSGDMNLTEELAAKGGAPDRWDDRELHELMNQHYKHAKVGPIWALQLLVLSKYDGGPKYRFDYTSRQHPCRLVEEGGRTANHGDEIVGLMFDDRSGNIIDPWTRFYKEHEALLSESDKRKISRYTRDGSFLNQRQRQGAAVFWYQLEASMAQVLNQSEVPNWYRNRAYFWTIMHELGHVLNLRHPTELGRKDSTSFMRTFNSIIGQAQDTNRGIADFWNRFDYRYDPEEIIHLKHGFYNEVVPGGRNYLDWIWPSVFYDSPVDNAMQNDLLLEILPHKSIYRLGEPVLLEVAVSNRSATKTLNIGKLGPSYGNVRLFITKPDGTTRHFKPIVNKVESMPSKLGAGDQKRHITNLTYSAEGFIFDTPGKYEILAIAEDQTKSNYALSLPASFRVGYPTRLEEEVADQLFDREVGLFLTLGGGEHLEAGKRRLESISEQYADHPLSAHAKLALRLNALKGQKRINPKRGTLELVKTSFPEDTDKFEKDIAESEDLPSSIKARFSATLQHFKAS